MTITIRLNDIENMRVSEAGDRKGVIVELIADSDDNDYNDYGRQYIRYSGGAWILTANGDLGRQIRGTADIRAPHTLTVKSVQAWARANFPRLFEDEAK